MMKLQVKNLNVRALDTSFSKDFDIDLTSTSVGQLIKKVVAEQTNPDNKMELVYRGQVLDKSAMLENCFSKKSGKKCLYLIESDNYEPTKTTVLPRSSMEIAWLTNQVTFCFKTKSSRLILERLLQNPPKLTSQLVKLVPALGLDSPALCLIQSFDVLKLLMDPGKCKKIVDLSPNVYQGVKELLNIVTEATKKTAAPSSSSSSSSGEQGEFVPRAAFSIDEMSEDEEQAAQQQQQRQQQRLQQAQLRQRQLRQQQQHQQNQQQTRPAGGPPAAAPVISQDYLSSVLANLNQQIFPSSTSSSSAPTSNDPTSTTPTTPTPTPTSTTTNPAPVPAPTQQAMSNQAALQMMQQLLAGANNNNNNNGNNQTPTMTATPTPPPPPPPQQQRQQQPASTGVTSPQQQQPQPEMNQEEVQAKLVLMHEFGFTDDALNIQALRMTNGNVEMAISFIVEQSGGF